MGTYLVFGHLDCLGSTADGGEQSTATTWPDYYTQRTVQAKKGLVWPDWEPTPSNIGSIRQSMGTDRRAISREQRPEERATVQVVGVFGSRFASRFVGSVQA